MCRVQFELDNNNVDIFERMQRIGIFETIRARLWGNLNFRCLFLSFYYYYFLSSDIRKIIPSRKRGRAIKRATSRPNVHVDGTNLKNISPARRSPQTKRYERKM